MTSLSEVKKYIKNADQWDLILIKDEVKERQKFLDNSKKVGVLVVMHGNVKDSYYAKDNKEGALARLYEIVNDDRYKKNLGRWVCIADSYRTEEELKVIKNDNKYFESGFPAIEELPFI